MPAAATVVVSDGSRPRDARMRRISGRPLARVRHCSLSMVCRPNDLHIELEPRQAKVQDLRR